jgi:hypothetical protein
VVSGDDDMILLLPGFASDSKFGAFDLRGDDKTILVVPEDGGVALGADVGSIRVSISTP